MSIDAQVRKVREIFPDLKIAVVYEERFSAFEPGKRPLLLKMLGQIDAGELDGIVAWHPDRLSRNEEDAAKITYRTRKGIIKDLRFCSYHFDNSPEGIMMLQLALSQSQYFSSKLSKDVKRGMEHKLKLGWRPGLAPVGYLNDVLNHEILEDPERFELVRRMWDRLLSGLYTPPRISYMAEAEWGLVTVKRKKRGGTPLSRAAIYNLFRDPFYAGLIRWDGKIYQGKHRPMVTLAEFRNAQAILDGGGNRCRVLETHDFAYRGLITCDDCGCQYTAELKKGHVYYHCTHKKKRYSCPQRQNIREEVIDEVLAATMSSHTIHPAFRTWALEYLAEATGREVASEEQVAQSRQIRIGQLEGQLDRLLDLKLRDLIDDSGFMAKQAALKIEIRDMEQQIASAKQLEAKVDRQLRRALDLATFGLSVLQYGSLKKKRLIAKSIGTAYTARDGRVDFKVSDWLVPFSGLLKPENANHPTGGSGEVRTEEVRDYCSGERKTAVSAAVCSLWQSRLDEVRKRLYEAIRTIDLPEFDALGDLIIKDESSQTKP